MPASPSKSFVRWRILGLSVAASFVAYVLRINVSIAGPAIRADWGLSEVELGLMLSAFAWGYAIFQVPGGLLGARFGARRAMTWVMIGWAAVTVITAVTPGPPVMSIGLSLVGMVGLRFLLGVLQAPLFPVFSGSVLTAWFPPTMWALPNGLTSTGLTLGAAAAGPLLAWLIGAVGWRGAFLVTAPLGLLMAALWWLDVRDDPATHPGVAPTELAVIRDGRRPVPATGDRGWWTVLKNRDVLAITFSYFCMNYVFYLFFNWFFYYLVEVRGLSGQVGGNFTGAQWIVGAIAAFVGGLICDALVQRIGPRLGCRLTALGGLLLTAPFLVAGVHASDPWMAVALLSLAFGCTQLTEGAFWTAMMRVAGPHAPVATGLMNTGGNVVGGIGAVMVPALAAAFGWTAAVSSGALFAVLAAVPWLWIQADRLMAAEA